MKKFHEAKDLLHRTKISKGQIKSEADQIRWRDILARDADKAGKLLIDIVKIGRFLHFFSRVKRISKEELNYLKGIIISARKTEQQINQYICKIKNEYDSPKDFAKTVIDFFENSLKPEINYMADLLDRYYLNACTLSEIINELMERFGFICNQDIKEILETARIIIAKGDFISCLENILANSAKAIGNIPNGQIWVKLSKKENYLELKIKDNGKGISREDLKILNEGLKGKRRIKGQGLNDTCYHLRTWEGEIEIKSDGPGQGTEFVIKFKIF